jgi:hypothetical protein
LYCYFELVNPILTLANNKDAATFTKLLLLLPADIAVYPAKSVYGFLV